MPPESTAAPESADPDPHDPEVAAALVARELAAGHPTEDRLFEEAEQAARDVEAEEEAE